PDMPSLARNSGKEQRRIEAAEPRRCRKHGRIEKKRVRPEREIHTRRFRAPGDVDVEVARIDVLDPAVGPAPSIARQPGDGEAQADAEWARGGHASSSARALTGTIIGAPVTGSGI